MDDKSLWPDDIFRNKITMPKKILLEQGNILSERTNNLLVAEIKSSSGYIEEALFNEVEALVHEFIIKAPSLGNYQLPLLRVIHRSIFAYPLKVYSILEEATFDIKNEDEFKSSLRAIFESKKTRAAISYIISQA